MSQLSMVPKASSPRLGTRTCAWHVVQQPLQLGGRKIGVDHEAGLFLDQSRLALAAQFVASCCGAPVLPDDGIGHGLAGGAVPQHRGLALVGDAYGQLARAGNGAQLLERLLRHGTLRRPDFVRVVFHPAGLGENLAKLLLRRCHGLASPVEHNGARAGRALVQCKNIFHGR
jgi:hypothetical protein